MKKRLIPIYIMLLTSAGMKAQTLQEMFTNEPVEQTPYLDQTMREELLKFADGSKDTCSIVVNALSTTAWISAINNNLIVLHPNEVYTEEYRMLPNSEKADSMLCVIKTYDGPEQESTITLYDKNWSEIRKIDMKTFESNSIISRPDTMSEEEFNDLKHSINFTMTKASFIKNDENAIALTTTTPLTTKEDKNKIKPLLLQKVVKWNGLKFN